MCIVFISTSHCEYSLVLISNRDEYVLRPTSRPHWWTHPQSGEAILSARDLQRPERSTWLAISRSGLLGALTNFQDMAAPATNTLRRRGGVLMDWMGEPADRRIQESVQALYGDEKGDIQGIGGFSLVCGKLRRHHEGLAVVSNRAEKPQDVPIVQAGQDQAWGITNTVFGKLDGWPKLENGAESFDELVRTDNEKEQHDKDSFIRDLFQHLHKDTFPHQQDRTLEGNLENVRKTIFVPLLGSKEQFLEMEDAKSHGKGSWLSEEELPHYQPPVSSHAYFNTGLYGTQRQTVILVDRDGNVTFVERALFDANGHSPDPVERDVKFEFRIEGWET